MTALRSFCVAFAELQPAWQMPKVVLVRSWGREAEMFGHGERILPTNAPEMQAQPAIYSQDRPLMRARRQQRGGINSTSARSRPTRRTKSGLPSGIPQAASACAAPRPWYRSTTAGYRDHAVGPAVLVINRRGNLN